jgi:hypothetical protein
LFLNLFNLGYIIIQEELIFKIEFVILAFFLKMSKSQQDSSGATSILSNYFSAFLGWGITTHPISRVILDYLEFFQLPLKRGISEKVPRREIADFFLDKYPKITLEIKEKSLRTYVECISEILINFTKMNNWFRTQDLEFQIEIFKVFKKEEIQKLVEIFHVSKKATASFIKTLSTIEPRERASVFISWWNKRLALEGVVFQKEDNKLTCKYLYLA